MRAIAFAVAIIAGLLPAFSRPSFADALAPSGPVIFRAMSHDLSPPLREMLSVPSPGARQEQESEEGPLPIPFPPGARFEPDGALQKTAPTKVKTIDLLNFPGVSLTAAGWKGTIDRPDANGAVGATQYVQFVNVAFSIFDKSTGARLLGPVSGHKLWYGVPGPCGSIYLNGDPIAQYDKLANRWVLSAIASTNNAGPEAYCVAVSQTSDATGAYYRYAFDFGAVFPDYDKMGVWPDAYYATFNTAPGSRLCALDRNAMLNGLSATEQCFQLQSRSYLGVLPADLDGTTAPPGGAPNYLINMGANSLNEWQFHVDWANPNNTSLTGPINIPVAAFTPTCGGFGGSCVPEKGGQNLNAVGDRLMYRLAYRNFGDHESLVVNHTVVAGTVYGVRWYELRTPMTPTVYQSGTYAPGASLYRWMGSIAMDKAGDIAVGYSASDSTEYPSIRYTGRTPLTAAGKLLGEKIVKTSNYGHQDLSWGDYTGMSVDPVDDCTFWYTNEYVDLPPRAGRYWQTEINAFKFPGCK